MPELPEIETIKSIIEPQIQGLTIKNVTVNRPEVIAHPTAKAFCDLLTGQTISRMGRRGKFLTITLGSGDTIVLHLRMTGCLLLTPADFPQEKHTHIVLLLSNEKELRFSDTRRFGRFWLLQHGETDTYSGIDKLGIEPLSHDFTAEYLTAHFGKRKKTVKECLLDQSVVAGIGNIYSDEILFAAGIYPARPANSLMRTEWERLAAVVPECLSYFIKVNKTTPEEYLETKGQDYRNTPFLRVYGQEGKPCPRCRATLCRRVIGGRSSVYCPSCQRDLDRAVSKVKLTITESKCRCGYCKKGDIFIVEDLCPPLCHELWNNIYPSVYALLNGAELDYGRARSRQFDAKCPDEGRVCVHGEVMV